MLGGYRLVLPTVPRELEFRYSRQTVLVKYDFKKCFNWRPLQMIS